MLIIGGDEEETYPENVSSGDTNATSSATTSGSRGRLEVSGFALNSKVSWICLHVLSVCMRVREQLTTELEPTAQCQCFVAFVLHRFFLNAGHSTQAVPFFCC